jgi:tRNA (mo5U34)-methyltransferase
VAERFWYHTIELPGGVVTPGEYDTRRALARIPFPERLDRSRCLDVGTHDGFWAFAMEARGAAEVFAIDLDDPREADISEPVPELSPLATQTLLQRPRAFGVAHRALGSSVVRRNLSVYELADEYRDRFDFAFIGTLLLHLRDPLRALGQVREALVPGGRLLVNEPVSLWLSLVHPRAPVHQLSLLPGRPFWWIPNARGVARYLEKAGFELIDRGSPYFVPRGPGYARPRPSTLPARLLDRLGMPHAWALARRR